MVNLLQIYETEEGDPTTITGRALYGVTLSDLSWAIEADCTIEVKYQDVVVFTLIGTSDFTLADPVFTWTPTDAQRVQLVKKRTYECYIHARNNGTPRERVLKFQLKLRDS